MGSDRVLLDAESHLGVVTVAEVMEAVAAIYVVDPAEYARFRSLAAGREMAALLCRRYTFAPSTVWHGLLVNRVAVDVAAE